MTITAADVAEIMRLVEHSNFDELTLEMDGIKLSLKRGGAASTEPASFAAPGPREPGPATTPAARRPATGAAAPDRERAVGAAALDGNLRPVPSPLLGTFYRAPKPGAPPFVEVGSLVEEDTVIAIIEVMKLMNAVRAGVRGTVAAILVDDGALVEYEQPLLTIAKAV